MNQLYLFLDRLFFLKKGYAVLAHVFPFGVAALLLLTLSVPSDNLLIKLVDSLSKPGLWLPAALLTVVSTSVYVISLYVQVKRAYLFSRWNKLRTIGTCLLFLLLCTFLAYVVLRSAQPGAFRRIGLWACFLVASLSLTGVGWSTPTAWVDSLGITHPDYDEAHRVAALLTEALKSIRAKSRGSKDDVARVLSCAANLETELQKNADKEPNWRKSDIASVQVALHAFVVAVKDKFDNADAQTIEDFAQVMNCKKETQYEGVISALRALTNFWREWKCDQ